MGYFHVIDASDLQLRSCFLTTADLLQQFADDALVTDSSHQYAAGKTFKILREVLTVLDAAELADAWLHFAAVPSNRDRVGFCNELKRLKDKYGI